MELEYCQDMVVTIKAQITSYQALLTSLASGSQKSYTLNNGQTSESVTRKDAGNIRKLINDLLVDLQFWQDCVSDLQGYQISTITRPGW